MGINLGKRAIVVRRFKEMSLETVSPKREMDLIVLKTYNVYKMKKKLGYRRNISTISYVKVEEVLFISLKV